MSFDGMEAVCVKQECDSEGCGDNEAALAALYEDHVVKEELVLGPELLQPRDVVYTLRASLKTEDKDTHEQTLLNGRCSVVLERLFLDTESQTYTIGLRTYSFRLCQNQDIQIHTDVNPRNKSSQACLPAVKKTESSKTNKRKTPVEEKKEKPSEKITKKNQELSAASQDLPSSTDIQKEKKLKEKNVKNYFHIKTLEPSASQDDLPSSTDVQAVSPEKPVVSKSYSKTNTLNGETNFRCDKCGKGFELKSDLEKHIRFRFKDIYSHLSHK